MFTQRVSVVAHVPAETCTTLQRQKHVIPHVLRKESIMCTAPSTAFSGVLQGKNTINLTSTYATILVRVAEMRIVNTIIRIHVTVVVHKTMIIPHSHIPLKVIRI